MDKERENIEEIRQLMNNRHMKELMVFISECMRRSVSGVTASGEVISAAVDNKDNDVCQEALDHMWGDCQSLMRVAEICDILAKDDYDPVAVSVDSLLNETAAETNRLLGEKFKVNITGRHNRIISCDEKAIKILILSVIRSIADCSGSSLTGIELAVDDDEENVVIIIKSSSELTNNTSYDFFKRYLHGVNCIIAERIGGNFEMTNDGCRLKMPLFINDERMGMRRPSRYSDNGRYSTFNIMLRAFDDEESET